jgi:hypothetical protein
MEALPEEVVVDLMQYMDIWDMVRLEVATSAGHERIYRCYKIAGLDTVTIGKGDSVLAIAGCDLHPSALIIIRQTLSEMREWDELRLRENLAPMRSFKSVTITENRLMDDACLKLLSIIFPNLRSLSIKRRPKVTPLGFGALSAMVSLRSLSLEACDMSDDKADVIATSVPGLRHLSMPGSGTSISRLDMLESLTLLETLTLWNNTLPDDAIEFHARLPALRSANLGWCGLSDASMPHLAACPSLTEVVLYDNPKIIPLDLLKLPATISIFTDLDDEPELGGYDDEAVEKKIRGERTKYLLILFDLSLLRCSHSCRQQERSYLECAMEVCDA